jgi:hypothetical protein
MMQAKHFRYLSSVRPDFLVSGVTLDAYQSHAVAALQDVLITTASPIYKHYWYTLVDDIVSTSNPFLRCDRWQQRTIR